MPYRAMNKALQPTVLSLSMWDMYSLLWSGLSCVAQPAVSIDQT